MESFKRNNEEFPIQTITTIYHLFVDWENFDHKQLIRNDGMMDLPIVIEERTEHTVENISLLCCETSTVTLSGKKDGICEIMNFLGENGYTSEKLDAIGVHLSRNYIDPQTIKFTKNTCLIIDGISIDFKEKSIQTTLLRAMFGRPGKNRIKLDFMDFYDIWATEENNTTTWEQLCLSDGGKEKAAFIRRIRNAATNINNKVRKAIGGTEDFLDTRNNVCKINPKLIKPNKI